VLRRIIVPAIIAIAVAIALISTSYPSVVIPNVTTQPFPAFETYTSQYQVAYPQSTASTLLAGYSSVTAWYPGNPICDPASNACSPYPAPTATYVYPQSMTYVYQITVSSQTAQVLTTEFTIFSTQTNYQKIPPYAAAGLTELQYGVVALVVVAAVALSLLFIFVRKHPVNQSQSSAKTARFCSQCGAQNPDSGKFCIRCGVRLE